MLTDVQARKAKATDKDQKLSDAGGLYLFVTRTGFKSWRMKYRYGGKEKRLTFGPYPEVSLAEARDRRDAARRLLRDDRDPSIEKMKARATSATAAATTFEMKAREWHTAQRPRWSPDYADLVLRALERDIFPDLGRMPIGEIDGPLVLAQLRKIERRGSIETAKRIRQHVSAVFVYAMAEGTAASDPSASLGKALQPLAKKGKQPAFVDIKKARQLLVDTEASSAGPVTKLASRLLALTAARPGILRSAPWPEFEGIDWDKPDAPSPGALWRVPAARMKLEMDRKTDAVFEHIIPLSPQAVDVLHALRRLTGRIALLFPSTRSTIRPMSENTIGYLYNRIGYRGRHVPHGWRACFSTIMNERVGDDVRVGDRAVIDLMLAHVPQGLSGSEAAYNRSQHMARRRQLADEWANLLMDGMAPANDLLRGQER
ncbi:tyrosine-type recombinase/integrase [Sphingomonas montana]|uniref:tyrosine-type recombinase/integrase n=1 Tax=Sphingomonas montana TaxID=1843236 RepID=UPI00096EA1D3|nr:integrase arm-type DNA-binding domain-containing protein [Sphingomonas montana]